MHVLVWDWRWIFDCTVSPIIVFGLAAVPFTCIHLNKLDAIHRCMLRSIVGWVRFQDESWRPAGHHGENEVKSEYGLAPHSILDWNWQWAKRQYTLARQIASTDSWIQRSSVWILVAFWQNNFEHTFRRGPGRPALTSDDRLIRFSRTQIPNFNSWQDAARCPTCVAYLMHIWVGNLWHWISFEFKRAGVWFPVSWPDRGSSVSLRLEHAQGKANQCNKIRIFFRSGVGGTSSKIGSKGQPGSRRTTNVESRRSFDEGFGLLLGTWPSSVLPGTRFFLSTPFVLSREKLENANATVWFQQPHIRARHHLQRLHCTYRDPQGHPWMKRVWLVSCGGSDWLVKY